MDLQVARTILEQLGGGKFIAMTGARHIVGSETDLSFTLPGGGGFCKDGINLVRIALTPADTYTVTFSRRRGRTVETVSEFTDIYFDQLQSVFESATGLRTSL